MRTYEVVFIVQPGLDDEAVTSLSAGIQQSIADNGGEIVTTEPMSRRRLAYPIGHHTEGTYMLLHANMERTGLEELDRRLKLTEDIIRHLVVRLDEVA